MLANPAVFVSVRQASAPPTIATSHRPAATQRAALIRACVPVAQAVAIVSHGPYKDQRIEIAAAAALGITMGTVRGDTARSPLSRRLKA